MRRRTRPTTATELAWFLASFVETVARKEKSAWCMSGFGMAGDGQMRAENPKHFELEALSKQWCTSLSLLLGGVRLSHDEYQNLTSSRHFQRHPSFLNTYLREDCIKKLMPFSPEKFHNRFSSTHMSLKWNIVFVDPEILSIFCFTKFDISYNHFRVLFITKSREA